MDDQMLAIIESQCNVTISLSESETRALKYFTNLIHLNHAQNRYRCHVKLYNQYYQRYIIIPYVYAKEIILRDYKTLGLDCEYKHKQLYVKSFFNRI